MTLIHLSTIDTFHLKICVLCLNYFTEVNINTIFNSFEKLELICTCKKHVLFLFGFFSVFQHALQTVCPIKSNNINVTQEIQMTKDG